MNIYGKINEIMKDVTYLQKDSFVETGKGRGYKAITEEKVTSTVRESMIKHGVVIFPIEQEHIREDEEVTDNYGKTKINRLTTVNIKYRVANVDDKEDYIDVWSAGTGVDTQDKGIGKAITYAYKYLLLRLFAIPTGEDADAISSDMYTQNLMGGNAPRKVEPKTNPLEGFTREQIEDSIVALCDTKNLKLASILKEVKANTLADLTDDRLVKCYEYIQKK